MVNMLNGWIVVERHDKADKDKARNLGENPFLNAMPVSNNYGKVINRCRGGGCSVGAMVYFGNAYEKIIMDGKEVLIMKADNIFATVTEG